MPKLKLLIIYFIYTLSLFANNERMNLQGRGMGSTFTAIARGTSTLGINPANLSYKNNYSVDFNLLNFSISTGSDLIDINIYNKYFTGDENGNPVFLTDQDKREILKIFPAGLAQTGFNFDLSLLAFTVNAGNLGSLAFSIYERAGLSILMPKDYLEFVLFGNLLNKKYDFGKTYFNALWCREYSFSYAREIPQPDFLKYLSAGLSIKLIHGYGFAEISHNRTYFATDAESKIYGKIDYQVKMAGIDILFTENNTGYSPFPKPAGTGIGFDLGLSGNVSDILSVGVALVNVGKISWKSNTYEHSGYAEFNLDDPKTAQEQLDSLDKIFKNTKTKISGFNTSLPTVLRLGIGYKLDQAQFVSNFPGEMTIAFDYNQGFNNLTGNTKIPRFSLGLEYKPLKWLPIRTGFSLGGVEGFKWGFGSGLLFSFMDLEFATENLEALIFPSSMDRISFGMGMRLKF